MSNQEKIVEDPQSVSILQQDAVKIVPDEKEEEEIKQEQSHTLGNLRNQQNSSSINEACEDFLESEELAPIQEKSQNGNQEESQETSQVANPEENQKENQKDNQEDNEEGKNDVKHADDNKFSCKSPRDAKEEILGKLENISTGDELLYNNEDVNEVCAEASEVNSVKLEAKQELHLERYHNQPCQNEENEDFIERISNETEERFQNTDYTQSSSVISENEEIEIKSKEPKIDREKERIETGINGRVDTENDIDEYDSESDFGDFSDASFEEFQTIRNSATGTTTEQEMKLQSPLPSQNSTNNETRAVSRNNNSFPIESITDIDSFQDKIAELVDQIFENDSTANLEDANQHGSSRDSITKVVKEEGANGILNERAKALWQELKNIPKLNPPDWKRSAIRRHFMISIGVPIDLNEVNNKFEDKKDNGSDEFLGKVQIIFENVDEEKEKSSTDNENDEDIILVRSLKQLKIDDAEKDDILKKSLSILNDMEEQLQSDIYYSSLLKEGQHQKLEQELQKFQLLKNKLEKVLSVWNKELCELNSDHETFSQVVENIVGYSQRLTRQESFKNLGKNDRTKKKNLLRRQSSSKAGFFWNT